MIADLVFSKVNLVPPIVSNPCDVSHYFQAVVGTSDLVSGDDCF